MNNLYLFQIQFVSDDQILEEYFGIRLIKDQLQLNQFLSHLINELKMSTNKHFILLNNFDFVSNSFAIIQDYFNGDDFWLDSLKLIINEDYQISYNFGDENE